MIEERCFSVSDLWTLVHQKHLDSIEKDILDSDLYILQTGYVDIMYQESKDKQAMTETQTLFVKHVLPNMIMHKVPKIEDVLVLYGLNMQTTFYHANAVWDPCGFFD